MTTMNINLKIDDKDILTKEGKTILEAAKENGIIIPTLCNLEGLSSLGGCRMCLVEVKGSTKLLPSCKTPVRDGMEVITNSETLKDYRKMTVQLLLSERTHVCSVCIANNNCELQDLANKLGVDHVLFERDWTRLEVDSTHDFLVIDRNRCVLCLRCVRVCDELEGVHTLDVKMRGKESQIVIDLDEHLGASYTCTSCRKCANVCPVGAIYIENEPLSKTKNKGVVEFVLSRRSP